MTAPLNPWGVGRLRMQNRATSATRIQKKMTQMNSIMPGFLEDIQQLWARMWIVNLRQETAFLSYRFYWNKRCNVSAIISHLLVSRSQQTRDNLQTIKLTQILGMQGDYSKSKMIYTFKVKSSRNYSPHNYMNPYSYLQKLRETVREKGLDIEFVEVKYLRIKSKAQKGFDAADTTRYDLGVQSGFNDVFGSQDGFLDWVFEDAVKLELTQEYDSAAFDNKIQEEKNKEELEKVNEIDQFLHKMMRIANEKPASFRELEVETLESFKMFSHKEFLEGEISIFVKALLTQPMKEKLEEDKEGHHSIDVKADNGGIIKGYFHKTDSRPESAEKVKQLFGMSSWVLGCKLPSEMARDNKDEYKYFGTPSLQKNVEELNESCRISSFIITNREKERIKSLELHTYLFDRAVLKVQINMGQVKRISRFQGPGATSYSFHLAYPPRYFLHLLRKDLAANRNYMNSWERIENVFFLRNPAIKHDDFMRLFLFSNTILQVTLEKENPSYRYQSSFEALEEMISKFNDRITIQVEDISDRKPMDFKWKVNSLKNKFLFEEEFAWSLSKVGDPNKVWIIKYFILIMVRCNHLYPNEVYRIVKELEENPHDIDVWIYVFWKITTDIWGYNDQKVRFVDYVFEQVKTAKSLKRKSLMEMVGKNSPAIVQVFRLNLTPSGYLYTPPSPEMKGRLLKEFDKYSEFFMRVSICDDHEGTLKNQKYITKVAFKNQMQKIQVLNRLYIPLGWSPSQLRAFSLWYLHEVKSQDLQFRINREIVLSFLGNFDDIQNPAKRAARIGQCFSSSWTFPGERLKETFEEDIISEKGFNFTDGIGRAAKNIFEGISLELGIKELSVIQIRYKGCKGLFVLDDRLRKNEVVIRPSMDKYRCPKESAAKYLDILDWNKYKPGYLNRQVIILLKTLKIRDAVFEELQKAHIDDIANMSFKDCSAFKQLHGDLCTEINNLEPASQTILHLIRAGFVLESEPFFRGVLETLKKNGYNQLKEKSNIAVEKSARIIGIIDEYGVLREGEVYCSIYNPFSLKKESEKRVVIDDVAIITRNPCLDPADIRRVTCVGRAEVERRFQEIGLAQNKFEPYLNTVIFPQKGEIPLTAQISGSDLDGDNFWICWDKNLIPDPKEIRQATTIDAPSRATKPSSELKKKTQEESYKEMLDFFVEYINYEKLGQIDNSHLVKADQDTNSYAGNKECMELCQIHGKAVDFPKTGYCPEVDPKLLTSVYPDFMEKEQDESYPSLSILGTLYRQIKSKIQDLLKDQVYKVEEVIDYDLLRGLEHQASDNKITKSVKEHIDQVEFEEIKEIFTILRDYEKTLANLIALVGIDTEYELYSGNFSIAKEKVDQYGKNRLISTILNLRQRYSNIFFDELPDDTEAYAGATEQDFTKKNLFSQVSKKRAILFYLVSYIYKFGDNLKLPLEGSYKKFRDNVNQCMDQVGLIDRTGKFCGFVWFVIPKIIINIKKVSKELKSSGKEYVHKAQAEAPTDSKAKNQGQQSRPERSESSDEDNEPRPNLQVKNRESDSDQEEVI